MATVKDSIPHVIRTAHEPRQAGMWTATLSKIEQVNSTIRLLRLSLPKDGPPVRHLPGQYVDLHIPSISTVGGFTITSPPQTCLIPSSSGPPNTPTLPDSTEPYLELAIQNSPTNPPAAYLWLPPTDILNSTVHFKIGGNFVYPPLTLTQDQCASINNIVFIAGGVGINPIISTLAAMDLKGIPIPLSDTPAWNSPANIAGMRRRTRVLYASKREVDGQILFEHRLEKIAKRWETVDEVDLQISLYETGAAPRDPLDVEGAVVKRRKGRITHADLLEALGPQDQRGNTLAYVCGVPAMTDGFVEVLRKAEGMEEKRVLCEKWW